MTFTLVRVIVPRFVEHLVEDELLDIRNDIHSGKGHCSKGCGTFSGGHLTKQTNSLQSRHNVTKILVHWKYMHLSSNGVEATNPSIIPLNRGELDPSNAIAMQIKSQSPSENINKETKT